MTSIDDPLNELMRLPPEDRLRAALTLLDSVDGEPVDVGADAANFAEWIRRLDEFEGGKVVAEDVEDVIVRVRARLNSKHRK